LPAHECEITRNGDPAWESGISLIVLANLPTGWGHGWARKMTPSIRFYVVGSRR
jgi:hypothetical protein